MSASVIGLFDRKPREIDSDTLVAQHVANRLGKFVEPSRLAQAQARAVRRLHAGSQMQKAIDYAVTWALGTEPKGAA